MSVNENKFQDIIQKIKDSMDQILTPSTNKTTQPNPNCIPNTNLFPTEDPIILDLEGKIKGYKMWLIGFGIFIAFVILTKIFNPLQLTTSIIYMIISTIIFFICLTMLAKMFLNVKNGISTPDESPINRIVYIIGLVSTFAIILTIMFSDEFKKNKALSMNFFILFTVLVLTCFSIA